MVKRFVKFFFDFCLQGLEMRWVAEFMFSCLNADSNCLVQILIMSARLCDLIMREDYEWGKKV
ncbi:MAG: hypothetical protein C4B55_03900 [Candidatus Methanophagaceae archaeon]|nr:MAG: hypothetical protein C4B55_03900 [Methanophagales archaeon]